MKVALIDMDNVLVDTLTSINRYRTKQSIRRGLLPAWKWDMSDYTNEDRAYVNELFETPAYFKQALPLQGAIPAMYWLKDYYEIVVITARKDTEEMYNTATNWLEEWQVPYEHLFFCLDKATEMNKLYGNDGIAFAVDDSPGQVAKYLAGGIRTYVLDYQYNRGVAPQKGLVRVNNLAQVLEHRRVMDELDIPEGSAAVRE